MNSSQSGPIRILVLDDEQHILDLFEEFFSSPTSTCQFELSLCHRAEEAVQVVSVASAEQRPFAVAFIDVRLPEGPDGAWAAEHIRQLDPDLEIVLITAYSDVDPEKLSPRIPPVEKMLYLRKPFFPEEIRHFAVSLAAKWQQEKELQRTYAELENRVRERTAELLRANEQLQREIAERHQAEKALRSSEKKYRDLVDNSLVGVFKTSRDGRILYANRALAEILEFESLEEMISKNAVERYRHSAQRKALLDRLERSGRVSDFEVDLLTKTGEIKNVLMSAVLDGDMISGMVMDITARKRAEEALRQSEEKYRLLVQHANDAIFIAQDGVIKFPNPKTEGLLGYPAEELATRPFAEFIIPEDRELVIDRYQRRLRGEKVTNSYSFRVVNAAGEVLWVFLNAVLIEWEGRPASLNFLRDITPQKKLEAQLLQAQKMEAIGTLAGGVAHDFNNLLQAVQGYAELLLLGKNQDTPGYRELQEIVNAARKGTTLTQQLLTFSRKVETQRRPLDLNHEVRQVAKLLQRTIPKMIKIELQLDDHLRIVNADAAQIEQVLMNLAVNAKDAMPEGGRLLFATQNLTLDAQYCEAHPGASPGDYVLLSISDTGHGMHRDTLDHVFEPFFTTKEVGKGTGLGLAIVYGIVKSHQGYITCSSEPARGTTFKIYLPAIEQPAEPLGAEAAELSLRGGSETILLVDDENSIRNLGSSILAKFGYTVITAASGEEALRKYRHQQQHIDLVILDLIMPGMGGRRCLEELVRLNPRILVLIASGYSPDKPMDDAIAAGASGFIAKPYQIREMLAEVRKVLDKS